MQAGATQIVGRSVDDFTAGFPTDVALDGRTAMVVYAMNGEPLPARHGFPARLVVAGLYGYVSATKWLREIELTTWEDFDGYWIPRGWSKEGPIKPQSRIDVPRGGVDLAAGPQPIAGVAWAPTGGISAVEVQVDDGDVAAGDARHRRPAATPGCSGGSTGTPRPVSTPCRCGRSRPTGRHADRRAAAAGTRRRHRLAPQDRSSRLS